ncbi:MAG: PAS domain S-box protein [Promethearchaeota archaeon]
MEIEKELVKFFHYYKKIFDITPCGMIISDLMGNILVMNLKMEILTGYTFQELRNTTFLKFFENSEDFKYVLTLLREQGAIENYEMQLRRKEGSKFWAALNGKLINIKNKDFLNLVFNDISDKKQLEDKVENFEKKYKIFTKYGIDYLVILDLKGRIKYINEKGLELSGYTKEDVLNNPFSRFLPMHHLKITLRKLKKRLKGNSSEFQYQIVFKNKDRKQIPLEVISVPIKKNNEIKEILVFAWDITPIKILEANLKEVIQRTNLYKDIFIHEINNLLQGIYLGLQLCDTYLNVKSIDKNILEKNIFVLKKQVKQGIKLSTNVNKISELENISLELKPIALNRMLRKSIKTIKKRFQDKNVIITLNLNNLKLYVIVNKLLEDVFKNILTNAIVHNDSEVKEIIINISREVKEREYAKIEFIDNGRGIEDERKEMIFSMEKMRESKSFRMGIELYLTKLIIDSYKGKIWVENRITGDHSKGSKFLILLPVIPN